MVIKIKGDRFSVRRESDGAGDAGPMLTAFDRKEQKAIGNNGEIQMGYSIMCGSFMARSFQFQDYWLTTSVDEILDRADDDSWVKVKTRNSVYVVRGI